MHTGGSPGTAHHHVQRNDHRRQIPYGPMRRLAQLIETPTATIELVGPRFIEQRYKSEAQFAPDVFERNRKARQKVSGGVPCVLLTVLPSELAVHPPSTNQDHYRADSDARSIIAMAVVAQSSAVNAATKFYFRYYAQAFEVRVFDGEAEAREWLEEVLGRVGD